MDEYLDIMGVLQTNLTTLECKVSILGAQYERSSETSSAILVESLPLSTITFPQGNIKWRLCDDPTG